MTQYTTEKIRNFALCGHGSSGKTTLADAMIYTAANSDRIGKIGDGTTLMDFDPEEKKRQISISTSVFQFEHQAIKYNMIDAPGLFDFAGGLSEAFSAADAALVVLSGKSGLSIGAKLAVELACKQLLPISFFVGKLDSPRSYFYRVISTLTANYGAVICPVVVPVVESDKVIAFVDLIDNKAYSFDGANLCETDMPKSEDVGHMRSIMLEAVASVDESLMEKYFAGEEFTRQEIILALKKGMTSREIWPVFCGINQTGEGVSLLLRIIGEVFPSADEIEFRVNKGSASGKLDCSENAPATAVVFKTIADPFVGKLSYLKVAAGKLVQDIKLVNSRTGEEEKIGKLMYVKGAKQEDAETVVAGDICCIAKAMSIKTGDTLHAPSCKTEIVITEFPTPCLSMAVLPRNKGDEDKIAAGIIKLLDEDQTIRFFTNKETHEQILMGLGEQHLDVVCSKLKGKFGLDVLLKAPKVAYRETIKKKVKVQGRHKKQSGGHGQYGDVWIEFEPCDADQLVFVEKVFGGSVPKNFFPAVEKGLRDSTDKGVLAGYPMVGIKATLVDGSYHPVDSSEMSFKMAAAVAFKNGIPEAVPTLLEPIGMLKVQIPDDIMGDVIGDINKRRGRVLGMNPLENRLQEIVAEAPMSEMGDFSTAMRSIAQGRATFNFEFERYEEAPPTVAQKVIQEAKLVE